VHARAENARCHRELVGYVLPPRRHGCVGTHASLERELIKLFLDSTKKPHDRQHVHFFVFLAQERKSIFEQTRSPRTSSSSERMGNTQGAPPIPDGPDPRQDLAQCLARSGMTLHGECHFAAIVMSTRDECIFTCAVALHSLPCTRHPGSVHLCHLVANAQLQSHPFRR
jgi:hypothetical protein